MIAPKGDRVFAMSMDVIGAKGARAEVGRCDRAEGGSCRGGRGLMCHNVKDESGPTIGKNFGWFAVLGLGREKVVAVRALLWAAIDSV